jgi:hypothetical protein
MNPLSSSPDDVKPVDAVPNGKTHTASPVGTSTHGATAVPAAPSSLPAAKQKPSFVKTGLQCVAASGTAGFVAGCLMGMGLRAIIGDFTLWAGIEWGILYGLSFGVIGLGFGLVIGLVGGLINAISGSKG